MPVWEESLLLKRGVGVKGWGVERTGTEGENTQTHTHTNIQRWQLTELSIVTAGRNAGWS